MLTQDWLKRLKRWGGKRSRRQQVRVGHLLSTRRDNSRFVEVLETRALLAAWVAAGPTSVTNGQVEGIANRPVSGAINVLAAHPSDAATIYVGTVNGGIWKTTDATGGSPTWTPQTDFQESLSIGALEFDPTDAGNNTLVAGIGRYGSYGQTGGPRTGLLRTTNGGSAWTAIDAGGSLDGKNISGLAVRGNTIVLSVNVADAFTFGNIGIFRSTNGGTSFTQMSTGNGSSTGLPGGVSYGLAADPTNNSVLYTSVTFSDLLGGQVGIYKSTDTGATWTKVSSSAIDNLD